MKGVFHVKHDFSALLAHKTSDHLQIDLSQDQLDQAQCFYDLLMEANQVMNLTAITDTEAVVDKHFIDSFLFAAYIPSETSRILDLGSGGGFPAIPLTILRPDLEIHCVDSLRKRMDFLEAAITHCGFSQVTAIHSRFELLAKKAPYRDGYSVVTARAVAQLPVLLEYAMPFVKVGGIFIAGKGPDLRHEISLAGSAAKALHARLITSSDTSLPGGDQRFFAIYEKTQATPASYPRKPGDAKRKPIL